MKAIITGKAWLTLNIGVMFSSPTMIMLFIFGLIIGSILIGAITTAIVQISKGRFKVDYDQIAAKAAREDEQRKREKKEKRGSLK